MNSIRLALTKIICLKSSSLRLNILVLVCIIFKGCNEPVPGNTPHNISQNDENIEEAHLNWPKQFNFGTSASEDRIAAWDIDVRPDGMGLPEGKGTVAEGSEIYALKCAVCHGATGTEGPEDRLVGRVPDDDFPFGETLEASKYKTIGGYWPYATTLFDYINRSMPQTAPGSLTADEVYALTAFLLHKNETIPEEAEMNSKSLPQVKMPAHDRFIPDDRQDYNVVH